MRALVVVAMSVAAARAAAADPLDQYGLGGAAAGQGGAVTATAVGAAATHHSPGAVGLIRDGRGL